MSTRGFTLVELMVALLVGSITVTLAHRVFAAVADGVGRLESVQRTAEAEFLGRRWLEAAFLSMESGTGQAFEGHADRLRFPARLVSGHGWTEPHPVSLIKAEGALKALGAGGTRTLLAGVESVAFDYLLEPGLDSRWATDWISPVSAPLAVRLRLGRATGTTDTMLFLIKGRG